jgi:hypothetical protein
VVGVVEGDVEHFRLSGEAFDRHDHGIGVPAADGSDEAFSAVFAQIDLAIFLVGREGDAAMLPLSAGMRRLVKAL